jgi:anti-anti-sigma regulatory factor
MWTEHVADGATVLSVSEPLRDSAQVEDAMTALATQIGARAGKKWIIDASGLPQINSETIATLIRIVRDVHVGGGRIALIRANEFLVSVLQTLRMANALHLHDTLEQALAYVNGRGPSAPT